MQKQAAAQARKRESDKKKLAAEIAACEEAIGKLSQELENVGADYEKAQKLTEENDALEEKLLGLYEAWEALGE
ncbi:MAG: hypothetical protein IJO50_05085 [Clostridia bacterium]|nr:hypothetical protein [Clostridia bacterium]